MSKAGKKNPDDVLRAGDMVPPFDDEVGVTKKKASASKKTGKAKAKVKKTAKSAAAAGKGSDIPQLDLDKRILAKERKVTSVKRKGPGGRSKAPAKTAEVDSTARRVAWSVPELSEQDRVIAEIVARDIQRLCKR